MYATSTYPTPVPARWDVPQDRETDLDADTVFLGMVGLDHEEEERSARSGARMLVGGLVVVFLVTAFACGQMIPEFP